MKIVFLDASTVGEVEALKKFDGLGAFVKYDYTPTDLVKERVSYAEVIITNKVIIDKDVINASQKLKLICVAATGTNNVDIPYATSKGIPVKNVKGYSTDSVVQQTFALMLSLTNQVGFYDRYVQSGEYSKSRIFTSLDKPFYEIAGKRLGIIGLGTIGRKVASVAEAFGMNVFYFSTSGKNSDLYFRRVGFTELLTEADIISIHAPLNEQTKGLIGESEFALMKPSSIILNTGRGGIINEEALAEALKSNRIAGAALDVFEKEPLPENSVLLNKLQEECRLILSPHIAWASVEARNRLVEGIVKNIEEYLKTGQ